MEHSEGVRRPPEEGRASRLKALPTQSGPSRYSFSVAEGKGSFTKG